MFFPSRERKGPDPYYPAKLVLFIVGTGLLLTGVRLERDWMIYVAIGVLVVAGLLRFLPRGSEDRGTNPPDHE